MTVKKKYSAGLMPAAWMRSLTVAAACCMALQMVAQERKSADKGAATDLQEVVVTGTGTRHLLKDAPVETQVITRKMLESYGGASLQDILNGLTASFDFNQGDMGAQMQMNGLGNGYILILIDGKRMHGDVGGENDLGLIDPHNIEKIEIVRGAHSALYGSDAIAGVINVITKNREMGSGVLLENSTRYGSYNDVRQHNGIGFRIGKVQSYTNFQVQHTDGWQNSSVEEAEGHLFTDSRNKTLNRYTNMQVAERLTYNPTNALELYLSGSYYWKRIYRPTGQGRSFDTYFYDLVYHNNSAAAGGKYKLNKTDYVTVDVDWGQHAYYHTVISDKYFGDGINEYGEMVTNYPYFHNQRILQSDQQRVMAQAKGVFVLPHNNSLSAGLEYRYDYLRAPLRVEGGTASDWTMAEYIQDEYTPVKWFNVTAGLRLNQNGAFGFRATPKVSTMFAAGDFRFRLGWSQGFKAPTPKELYYKYIRTMGGKLYYYMGNKDLDAQTSNYWSANVEYHTGKVTASVTGYVNVLKNMITLVTVPETEMPPEVLAEYWGLAPTARKYMNMEDAKTYGVDVSLSYNVTKELTVGGTYSYLNTDAHVYDTDKEQLVNVTIDGMAHHRATIYGNYNHRFSKKYKLGAGIYGRLSTKRYYQIDGDGKGYNLWRLTTTHDFGNSKKMSYRLEAGIDNIFNYRDMTQHGYHLGTTTPGRTFYATFTVKFNSGKSINTKSITKRNNNDEED